MFEESTPGNWSAALRQLAGILPEDRPSIVVIDEATYLMERVDAFEGVLQRSWDRELSRKPVLLVLIGSDLAMMKALDSYGRPFHQRGTQWVLGPLNPVEVAQMLHLEPISSSSWPRKWPIRSHRSWSRPSVPWLPNSRTPRRNGVNPTMSGLDAAFGTDELFQAWQPRG